MPKLDKLEHLLPYVLLLMVSTLTSLGIYKLAQTNIQIKQLQSQQTELQNSFQDTLFNDHLQLAQQIPLTAELESIESQLTQLKELEENDEYLKLEDVYKLYQDYAKKLARNQSSKLDTGEIEKTVETIGDSILNKKYEEAQLLLTAANSELDKKYTDYLATLPKPSTTTGEGYSYTSVDTERGKFNVYLIKVPLSSVKVVTASANGDDCKDNCPTKSLAQHIQDNGGFAGMNGAYFCPPDYSNCSGKVNSSDYAFYKSSSGKWLNKGALSWGDTGLATFNGHSAKFYRKSSSYDGDSVTAGLSNYPTLVSSGDITIDNGKLSSYQKDVKGLRGAIGVGESNLYLAIISNATVPDAAYVMRALGAKDALNLDGGGSSAMYINGSYVVGPGRSLPSAVVLTK